MSIRIYKLEGGTGAKGAVAGLLFIGVGAVFLVFGLALLAALAVAGTALGAGILLYRRITGRSITQLGRAEASARLDPSLEVFANDPVIASRPADEVRDALPPG